MSTTQQLTITRVGWRAQLTDLGRHDTELRGVPAGGAADRLSATVANTLVGNTVDQVLIETIGPITVVSRDPWLAAVTGAPAMVTIGGSAAAQWSTLLVPAGQPLTIGSGTGALRTYLAVGGQIQAPRFLHSAAPDQRMGFDQSLTNRTTVTLAESHALARVEWPSPGLFRFDVPRLTSAADGCWTLRVVPAAEHGLVPAMHDLLQTHVYRVKPESDHVGVRLSGPVVHPEGPEIVSHGVPVGAVEIPHADDELILLGRYRTLTAGYPIIGVVARTDLNLIGQLVPGQTVRFTWIDRAEAVTLAAAQHAALATLARTVQAAFRACLMTAN